MQKNLVFAKTSETAKHPNRCFFTSTKDGQTYYFCTVRNRMMEQKSDSDTILFNGIQSAKSYEIENVSLAFMSKELLVSYLWQNFDLFAVVENDKLSVCHKNKTIVENGIRKASQDAEFFTLEELAESAVNPDFEIRGVGYIQFHYSYYDESEPNKLRFQQVKTSDNEIIVRDYTTGKYRTLGSKDKPSATEMPVFRAWRIAPEVCEHRVWTKRSLALEKPAQTEVSEEMLEQEAVPTSADDLI